MEAINEAMQRLIQQGIAQTAQGQARLELDNQGWRQRADQRSLASAASDPPLPGSAHSSRQQRRGSGPGGDSHNRGPPSSGGSSSSSSSSSEGGGHHGRGAGDSRDGSQRSNQRRRHSHGSRARSPADSGSDVGSSVSGLTRRSPFEEGILAGQVPKTLAELERRCHLGGMRAYALLVRKNARSTLAVTGVKLAASGGMERDHLFSGEEGQTQDGHLTGEGAGFFDFLKAYIRFIRKYTLDRSIHFMILH